MNEQKTRQVLLILMGLGGLMVATKLFFGRVLKGRQVYRSDALGNGRFNGIRHGHRHEGVDIVADGLPVFSPMDAVVERIAIPYPGDDRFSGVVLQNDGLELKIFYLDPDVYPGQLVRRGQLLGTSQDVRVKYGAAMQPHIHVEIRRDGVVQDPGTYLSIEA